MPVRKIKRLCACGCGRVTNPGRKWICGHHTRKFSEETKRKMSLSQMGKKNKKGKKGYKLSKKTKLKMSLAKMKYNPNDEYCDIWRDKGYRKDLRKDYCENINCKGNYKLLVNHHIDLNKKHCRPSNVMTLCSSCSSTLH